MSFEFNSRPDPSELVGSDNATFRKGLVFGLTLAEVILLLVFMLLLALGALLKQSETKANNLAVQAGRAVAAEQQLKKLLSDHAPDASKEAVDEWVSDLVDAAVSTEDNKALRERLSKALEALSKVQTAAERSGMMKEPTVEAKRETAEEKRWEATAESLDKMFAELRALREANKILQTGDRSKIARELTEALIENERLEGTVAYSKRRLEALGKGTERTACWATKEGRPEYIFQVSLGADGITIQDRGLQHRAAQQAKLPIQRISFGRALGPAEFRAQTRPLFDWGEAHDCRFFVIATDRTGAAQKEIFKQRLRVMEEHFYKYLEN